MHLVPGTGNYLQRSGKKFDLEFSYITCRMKQQKLSNRIEELNENSNQLACFELPMSSVFIFLKGGIS